MAIAEKKRTRERDRERSLDNNSINIGEIFNGILHVYYHVNFVGEDHLNRIFLY